MATFGGFTVRVEGLDELRRALREAPIESRRLVRQANRDAAEVVVPAARQRAPRRSGRLADSVRATADNRGGYVTAGTGVRVPYAGPIHFGWPTRPNKAKGWRGGPIAPNPFVYEAADARREEVFQTYEQAMERLSRTISFG